MKKILKKNYLTLTLASLLLLWSCQSDFEEEKLMENMKVSHKNFQDLINQTKFSSALEKVEEIKTKVIKASKIEGKTVMENQYNFTIVNSAVNVAQQNGITSYTMLITRENTLANELENLIVQVDAQNKVEAFIMKYTNSSDFNENFSFQNFNGTKTIMSIEYNINQAGKIMASPGCHIVSTWYCYGAGHHETSDGCTMGFPIDEEVCPTPTPGPGGGEGGTSSPRSGNTSPNSGGSANEPLEPRVVTVPVAPKRSPCTLLGIIKKDSSLRSKFANLSSAASQWSFEKGFTIYENETPTKSPVNNFAYNPVSGAADNPYLNYSYNTTIQGLIHSHYASLLSIFSPTDLAGLYQKMKYPDISDGYFEGVVSSTGIAYIIQIQDRAAFLAFGDKYLSSEDAVKKFDVKIYQGKYDIKMENSKDVNEKGFLKMISDMNMGTNIASSPFVPNAPGGDLNLFKDWTPIKYNPTNDKVEPQNCN